MYRKKSKLVFIGPHRQISLQIRFHQSFDIQSIHSPVSTSRLTLDQKSFSEYHSGSQSQTPIFLAKSEPIEQDESLRTEVRLLRRLYSCSNLYNCTCQVPYIGCNNFLTGLGRFLQSLFDAIIRNKLWILPLIQKRNSDKSVR